MIWAAVQNHFGPKEGQSVGAIISSYPIFVVGILNLCKNLSCFLFHRQHRNLIKKRNQIFIKERQFFPHLCLIIDSSHFKFIHLPLILASLFEFE